MTLEEYLARQQGGGAGLQLNADGTPRRTPMTTNPGIINSAPGTQSPWQNQNLEPGMYGISTAGEFNDFTGEWDDGDAGGSFDFSGGDLTPVAPPAGNDPGQPFTPGFNDFTGSYGGGSSGLPSWLTSLIPGLLGGTAGTAAGGNNLANLLGTILGGVGANDLNQQARETSEFARGIGAPSRGRYESSMTSGFDPNSIPGYTAAVDDAMSSQLRGLSTQGNPFGNPGGLIEANKKVISGTALPAIQAYQNANANTGGYSAINSAIPGASLAALLTRGNLWDAGGNAAQDIFGQGGLAGGGAAGGSSSGISPGQAVSTAGALQGMLGGGSGGSGTTIAAGEGATIVGGNELAAAGAGEAAGSGAAIGSGELAAGQAIGAGPLAALYGATLYNAYDTGAIGPNDVNMPDYVVAPGTAMPYLQASGFSPGVQDTQGGTIPQELMGSINNLARHDYDILIGSFKDTQDPETGYRIPATRHLDENLAQPGPTGNRRPIPIEIIRQINSYADAHPEWIPFDPHMTQEYLSNGSSGE